MNRIHRLVLLLIGLSIAISSDVIGGSNTKLPRAANDALLHLFPSLIAGTLDFAVGDINQDDIPDIVAIVHYLTDGQEMESVVVLKGVVNGGYLVAAESASFPSHWRRNERVSLRNGSILLTAYGSASHAEYDSRTYRFRWRSGQCILVGFDYELGEIGGKSTHRVSANFLTNKVIEWRNNNGKPSTIRKNLTKRYTTTLEEFALDTGVGDLE